MIVKDRRSVWFSSTLCIWALLVSTPAKADDLLARTGQQVSTFLDQFSQVKCSEEVTQIKLIKKLTKSSVEYQEQQTFDYLMLAQGSGDDLVIQESRLLQKSSEHKKNISLLLTNGFATLSLIFHPYYQVGFEFSAPEGESLNGRALVKIQFQHIKGKRTPTVLVIRGREYPLELKGAAWIDPSTATIVRMQADLQDDMSDIGLQKFASDVEYEPVRFRGIASAYWLPATATIELETPKQRWRNVHHFTSYQQFSVVTDETVKTK
jgi:hypothetical protein